MAVDVVREWPPVYPHIRYADPERAIEWLSRVFGFRERVRMAKPDRTFVTSKLEGPDGGIVMVAAGSADFEHWVRDRVSSFEEGKPGRPNLTHSTTVLVTDVVAHYRRATAEGATVLMEPTDHPWGLRSYAAFDLEGHQWEFAQVLRIVDPEGWGASRVS